MKVKHIVDLLLRFDQDMPIRIDVKNDAYTQAWVSDDGRTVYLTSLTGRDDRDFYRRALLPGPDGPKTYIQTYQHLRATTEEECAEDLRLGAITEAEHTEDVQRLSKLRADILAANERHERTDLARLQAKYGLPQDDDKP